MKFLTRSVVFNVMFLCAALAASAAAAQQTRMVARVIDGDTFVLADSQRVRLIGVNTPETVHPSKPVQYFGKEAGAFTRSKIQGKRVILKFDVRKKDRYRRLLAYVYLEDGTFLNAELVRQGYANAAPWPPNVKYADLFRRLERRAREESKGLWARRDAKTPRIHRK